MPEMTMHMAIGEGARVTVDLSTLPDSQRYEDRYQGYLTIFERIAALGPKIRVTAVHAPWSWVPLLWHLNVDCVAPRAAFEHCRLVRAAAFGITDADDILPVKPLDRTAVEVLCGFRPECVDALWKIDMQWKPPEGRVRAYNPQREFIVTNNGSFHRQEVLDYHKHLAAFRPNKKNVVLVPCAADKPYPAPMHRAVLNIMPDDFYMMNATGVVGLVPQSLWSVMPWYDSGIPNEWRLYHTVKTFFSAFDHDLVVVYLDFYSVAVCEAFQSMGFQQQPNGDWRSWRSGSTIVRFVIPVDRYDDYLDLMTPDRLEALRVALTRK